MFPGSLIICSVACGESFPFVIQTLYNGPIWVPIVVSTLLLAIFAEIIPQYYIPRQAITWGYYCWPIIWGCMVLTAIISWPISWLMDRITSRKDNYGIFTNDQLGALIKYHERSMKRGGQLGPDTSRIVVGALSLESCRIGGATAKLPNPTSSDNEKDVEKAELTAGQDMIVSWRAVKTVNINESVDKAFIKKIKSWAYSRIPVIGESCTGKESENHPMAPDGWEGTKIFGFLHIKVNVPLLPRHFVTNSVLMLKLGLVEPCRLRHQKRARSREPLTCERSTNISSSYCEGRYDGLCTFKLVPAGDVEVSSCRKNLFKVTS